MKKKDTEDLHGSAPDKCECALLLIDVINAMDFEGGKALARQAVPVARKIAALKARAYEAKVPVVYVNDNFGKWRSDFNTHVQHCLNSDVPGRKIVEQLLPGEDDYFVLKPKHSGFYSTSLSLLLQHLKAKRLILTGFAGNLCVLYTANDAYMRDYELVIPKDCIASVSKDDNAHALEQMKRQLKANIQISTQVRFPK